MRIVLIISLLFPLMLHAQVKSITVKRLTSNTATTEVLNQVTYSYADTLIVPFGKTFEQYGGDGTDALTDQAAWESFMDVDTLTYTLWINSGAYDVDSMYFNRPVNIICTGNQDAAYGTVFRINANAPGVYLDTGAHHSYIKGLKLHHNPAGGESTEYGFHIKARFVHLENCLAQYFPSHGFYLEGDSRDSMQGAYLEHCRSENNSGAGFVAEGPYANGNTIWACDASLCGEEGMYDKSVLGNLYAGGHGATNGDSHYKNDSAPSVFVGTYGESGSAPDTINGQGVTIGGIHANLQRGTGSIIQAELGGSTTNFANIKTEDLLYFGGSNDGITTFRSLASGSIGSPASYNEGSVIFFTDAFSAGYIGTTVIDSSGVKKFKNFGVLE